MVKYLIVALRAFRTRTEGQFGQVTEHVLPLTQDAADALEKYVARADRVFVSLDGETKQAQTGLVSNVRWAVIAGMLEKEENGKAKVLALEATPDGLQLVWGYPKQS